MTPVRPLLGRSQVRDPIPVAVAHVYCSAIVIWFWYVLLPSLDPDTAITATSWAIGVAVIWSLVSWHLCGHSLLDAYTLFLYSVAIFNGGLAGLEVFGLNPRGILDGRFSAETLLGSLTLVLVAILALHAGALLGILKRTSTISLARRGTSTKELWQVGTLLLVISALPAVLALRSDIATVQASGYFSLYQQDVRTSVAATPRLVATMLPTALMFMVAGGRGRSRLICACTLGLYSAAYLFMGFRGTGIATLAAALWLWERTGKSLPRSVKLVGLVTVVLMIPVVGALRSGTGEQRLDPAQMKYAWSSVANPVATSVAEMGQSLQTISYTMDLVHGPWSYEYGATYAAALSTILPNLFWDIHPGISRSPHSRLIWEVAPGTAAGGGGLGYSCIAEAFLNFGLLGTPAVMLLIGYGLGRTTVWLDATRDPARLAVLAAAIVPLIMYARADTGDVTRGIVW
jgi:O-antigen polysaccharide polymerase Wzy